MTIRISTAALAVCCAFPFSSLAASMGDTVVVTATRSARTVDDSLSAVSVVTREDIARLQPRSVPDLLRGLPGIALTNNGGRGKQTSVFLRGTESDHMVVLIDGVKVGSATSGSAAFQDLPVDLVERIEIVRGPRSSLYGSEAIGGVIQIFTKRGAGAWRPNFSVGVGSNDSHKLTAGLDGGNERGWVSLNLSNDVTDGFNACRVEAAGVGGCRLAQPDRDGYDNLSGAVRAGYRFDGGAEVNFNWMRTDAETEYDGSAFAGNYADTSQEVFGGRLVFSPLAAWTVTLGAGQSTDESDAYYNGGFISRFDTTRTTFSWQNDIALGSDNMLTLGVDHQEDEIDSTTAYPVTERTTRGVYAFYQGAVGAADYQLSVRSDDNKQFGDYTTGSVAGGYALSDTLRVTASWGRAFKAPSFNELYFPFYGNTALVPERSRSVELGLAGRQGWGQWSVNAFETKVDDLIAYDSTISKANNVDAARIRGIEASAATRLAEWDLRGNLTLLDPDNLTAGANHGNVLTRRTQKSLRLEADRNYGKFSFGTTLVAEGGRYDDLANKNRLGGYATVDLRAAYQLDADWRVEGVLTNVFDHDYETARFYVQEGRAVFVTLKYQPAR